MGYNLAKLSSHNLFADKIKLFLQSMGSYEEDGSFTAGTETEISITASVEPYTGENKFGDVSGQRLKDMLKVFIDRKHMVQPLTQGLKPKINDKCIYQNNAYVIDQVSDWVSGNYIEFICRLEQPESKAVAYGNKVY